MELVLKVVEGVGEYGIDSEHSPGVGAYYVKLYDGSYDSCGFDTEEEAATELEFIVSARKEKLSSDRPAYYDAEGGSMCNGIGRSYF